MSLCFSSLCRWSRAVPSWARTGEMWARERWKWSHRVMWSTRSTEHSLHSLSLSFLFLPPLFNIISLHISPSELRWESSAHFLASSPCLCSGVFTKCREPLCSYSHPTKPHMAYSLQELSSRWGQLIRIICWTDWFTSSDFFFFKVQHTENGSNNERHEILQYSFVFLLFYPVSNQLQPFCLEAFYDVLLSTVV